MSTELSRSLRNAIETAQAPHHLREALNTAGDELLHDDFSPRFKFRVSVLAKRAVSKYTLELLEDLLDDLEIFTEKRKRLVELERSIIEQSSEVPVEVDANLPTHADDLILYRLSKTDYLKEFDPKPGDNILISIEREAILKTLQACNFNRTQTCKALGISIRTLRNKLSFYLGRYHVSGYGDRKNKVH